LYDKQVSDRDSEKELEHMKAKKKKKKQKSIISPKIDKLLVRVIEDEEDDLLEEAVEVILKTDPKEKG
jgi:hypothetical protein